MSIQHADMDRYAAAVRAALADLTAEEVAELTEDLENHLSDVIAETTEPLEGRLGSPEDYAAELRLSAGLPPRSTPAAPASGPRIQQLIRGGIAESQQWLGQFAAWNQFRAFLPELRPAWWVARGVLVAMLLMAVTGTQSRFIMLVLGGVLAWASVAIGRRMAARRPAYRWLVAANAAIAFAGLVLAVDVFDRWAGPVTAVASYSEAGQDLTNLQLYDKDGKPLRDVQVFDQNGNPVTLGGQAQTWYQPDGSAVGNVFPRAPYPGEWTPEPAVPPVASAPPPLPSEPPGRPGVTPSPPVSGSPSPSPSPTAAPSGSPVPR